MRTLVNTAVNWVSILRLFSFNSPRNPKVSPKVTEVPHLLQVTPVSLTL